MKHQLLKYGIRDGVELHISTVEHGLKCNSTCPCCGMILIAKKGRLGKPQSHFAHKNLEQCEFAYETSIHYEAKRLLEKEKRISLPYRIISFDALKLQKSFQPVAGTNNIGIIKSRIYELKNITSEKRLHNIVPDIQATIKGKEILIEIAVTNKVKEIKSEKIKSIGIPTLEIDLSTIDRQVTEEDLRLNLFQNSKNKKWIFNPKDDELIEEIKIHKHDLEEKIIPFLESYQIRGTKSNPAILNCPNPFIKKKKIGIDYCRNCQFLCCEYEFNILCGAKNYLEIKELIETKNNELKPVFNEPSAHKADAQ